MYQAQMPELRGVWDAYARVVKSIVNVWEALVEAKEICQLRQSNGSIQFSPLQLKGLMEIGKLTKTRGFEFDKIWGFREPEFMTHWQSKL